MALSVNITLTKPLICGEYGSKIIEMPIAASEVFSAVSGHFVCPDGSGYLVHASSTAVNIIGWGNWLGTASSTAGGTTCGVDVDLEKLYILPACTGAGTYPTEAALIAAVGESCDLYTASNKQWANVAASSIDIIIVYGYNYVSSTESYVVVKANWEKIVNTGVA